MQQRTTGIFSAGLYTVGINQHLSPQLIRLIGRDGGGEGDPRKKISPSPPYTISIHCSINYGKAIERIMTLKGTINGTLSCLYWQENSTAQCKGKEAIGIFSHPKYINFVTDVY